MLHAAIIVTAAPNFWVYILHCNNGSFYTGYTTHLIRRYRSHKLGVAAKYTRSFPPLYMAQTWPVFGTKQQAMHIERSIKKMNKEQKQGLIEDPRILDSLYS